MECKMVLSWNECISIEYLAYLFTLSHSNPISRNLKDEQKYRKTFVCGLIEALCVITTVGIFYSGDVFMGRSRNVYMLCRASAYVCHWPIDQSKSPGQASGQREGAIKLQVKCLNSERVSVGAIKVISLPQGTYSLFYNSYRMFCRFVILVIQIEYTHKLTRCLLKCINPTSLFQIFHIH